MDRRLIIAAQTGNVELLLKLMEDDPLMLHSVALAGGDNPLHMASMAGHLNFVQQIVKLKGEFAWELNQDGFSPLHIASANGYVEIVKELLEIDHDLCLVRGRERRIPLHCAALKGRVHVVEELLAANPNSVGDVTARGETALHLAVKNYQFDVLTVLLKHLKDLKNEVVVNTKDERGNTILHLAVSKKQYEVIESLVGENSLTKAMVEVNCLNKNGLTPLDALLVFQSEAGDREIEEILRRAGGVKASDLTTTTLAQPSSSQLNDDQIVEAAITTSPRPERAPPLTDAQRQAPSNSAPADYDDDVEFLEYLAYKHERDSPSEIRNTILVIAALTATATYQAVFNPIGGLWQDDSPSNSTRPAHTAGKSILATKNMVSYCIFLAFNSTGFYASLSLIYVLTYKFPMKFQLQRSVAILSATFGACTVATAPNDVYSTMYALISSLAIPYSLIWATSKAHAYRVRRRKVQRFRRLQNAA